MDEKLGCWQRGDFTSLDARGEMASRHVFRPEEHDWVFLRWDAGPLEDVDARWVCFLHSYLLYLPISARLLLTHYTSLPPFFSHSFIHSHLPTYPSSLSPVPYVTYIYTCEAKQADNHQPSQKREQASTHSVKRATKNPPPPSPSRQHQWRTNYTASSWWAGSTRASRRV